MRLHWFRLQVGAMVLGSLAIVVLLIAQVPGLWALAVIAAMLIGSAYAVGSIVLLVAEIIRAERRQ